MQSVARVLSLASMGGWQEGHTFCRKRLVGLLLVVIGLPQIPLYHMIDRLCRSNIQNGLTFWLAYLSLSMVGYLGYPGILADKRASVV